MSNQKEIRCPACGSSSLKKASEQKVFTVPYAKPAEVELEVYTCSSCGESGDFARQNDAKYLAVEKSTNQTSVQTMLDDLGKAGITMAYFERAMQLPQRTLARWKDGNFSGSALALLRVVRTFPWVLSVAESGFESAFSQKTLLAEAGKVAVTAIGTVGTVQGGLNYRLSDDRLEINAKLVITRALPTATEVQPAMQFVSSGG